MAKRKEDKYVNQITSEITMSAANTLTFLEVDIGVSLFQKIALLIQRIEYTYDHATVVELASSGDLVQMALCTSNQIGSIELDETPVIDKLEVDPLVATSGIFPHFMPVARDFSMLRGGGLITTPKPLYIAMNSSGFVNPVSGQIRIYFTLEELSDADYFELLEARRFLG